MTSFFYTFKVQMAEACLQRLTSVAAGKVAYLKSLKYEDWHRKRLVAHIRSDIFGNNEYFRFIPTKKTGHKIMRNRLKGPMRMAFYEENDDRIVYSMTRSRKVQMQGITHFEQSTLFTYRRQKKMYWKQKVRVQTGKARGAAAIKTGAFPQKTYRHSAAIPINTLKHHLGLQQCNAFNEINKINDDIKIKIKELYDKGETKRNIANGLNLDIRTVREQIYLMHPKVGVGIPLLPEALKPKEKGK